MRPDIFSNNDNVLLVGEGNFSFSKCLCRYDLPIAITATCFEKEPLFEDQQENINYLLSKKGNKGKPLFADVPVLFNVDATKLHENPNISKGRFSKIIFNFPHVGGKMKIHLNRKLLGEFFESSSRIIDDEGAVLVSLCQGQGGTPADRPRRNWPDTWQVTEMAARGNFVLAAVEPFRHEFFQDYKCVGYRSQDAKFNTRGALVHFFLKRKPAFDWLSSDEDVVKRKSEFVPLVEHPTISVPCIYSEMYENSPLRNPSSSLTFLKDLFVEDLKKKGPGLRVKVLMDECVEIFVQGNAGAPCILSSGEGEFRLSLRQDPSELFIPIFRSLGPFIRENDYVFFSSVYFSLASDDSFPKNSPAKVKFLLWGKDLSKKILEHVLNLKAVFKDSNVECELQEGEIFAKVDEGSFCPTKSVARVICRNVSESTSFVAATVHVVDLDGKTMEVCVFNADYICHYFFQVKHWAEVWAKDNKVSIDGEGKPKLHQISLYPSTYRFDITLRYEPENKFSERKMREILWCAAGRILEDVELVNVYASGKGWSSSCYRISYKCLDGPLSRARALDIHSKVVGPMLASNLNVDIG